MFVASCITVSWAVYTVSACVGVSQNLGYLTLGSLRRIPLFRAVDQGPLLAETPCCKVRYRSGEDLGLDMHTDDSDVTMNLCLGLEFAGAGLQFCGMVGATDHRKHCYTYYHKKGTCVIHLGRRRHGADDITSGERLNLILWNHSSTYRASDESENPDYLIEEGPPDAVCVSYTHDRDFGNFKVWAWGFRV
ncbi:ICU11 [Symbiodinium sp. CCMP2592]|nr:ICU11 [Symbiodinium sp. CCMP2592]